MEEENLVVPINFLTLMLLIGNDGRIIIAMKSAKYPKATPTKLGNRNQIPKKLGQLRSLFRIKCSLTHVILEELIL